MGLIARYLEARGLPTVTLANMRVSIGRVLPSRTLLARGPRGQTVAAPHDGQGQMRAVRAALTLADTVAAPGTLIALDGHAG